jgi:SAM-dependent methyltransferase
MSGRLGRLRRPRAVTSTPAERPRIREVASSAGDDVDRYWTGHTVNSQPFASAEESERYLQWRFDEYPLFREFSGLYGEHDGETVLDYGCGPGNDVVGFALYSGARRVIGVDVSPTALELAAQRVALHGIDPDRVELIRTSDAQRELGLDDASVDHVSCQGVLHHTTDPDAILGELHRVLRPGGTGSVMVYHRDSVWWHLWTAYDRMVVDGTLAGLDVAEAFRRNTDGPECPISMAYTGGEFIAICERAGFQARFVGGYLARHELERLRTSWADAIVDDRLDTAHRAFLRELTYDVAGRPMHRGFHAGIGGSYRLRKPV